MKRILTVTNLLLLTAVFFMACSNNESTGKKEAHANTTGGTGNRILENTGTDVNQDLYGLIDDSLAVIMSEAYRDDLQKSRVKGNKDELDARSIWFDLETIKLFIAKIEASVASDKKCEPLKLGIRMYYAKYPEQEDMGKFASLNDLGSRVAGKHTVFMTPTYYHDGEDIDFNFEEVGDNPCMPIPYSQLLRKNRLHKGSIFTGVKKLVIADPRITGVIPNVENHGGLMPPPASGGTFPTGGQ